MRSLTMMLAMTLAVAPLVPAAAADKSNAEISRALAGHTLTSFDGTQTTLSSFKGEVIVVNFWASWCAPCRTELPVLNAWHASWADRGARVVAISIDKEARTAKRFAEKEKLTLTLFHDGPAGLARTLDLPSLPCTFLLDKDGEVVSVIRGSSDKELAALEREVESLLASSRKKAVQKAAVESTPAPEVDTADRTSTDGGSP